MIFSIKNGIKFSYLFVFLNIFTAEEAPKKPKIDNISLLDESNSKKVEPTSLKDYMSDICQETNNNQIFPTDLSQIIIDYTNQNEFFEILKLKNIAPISHIAWSPDGSKIAVTSEYPDKSIKIIDVDSGKMIHKFFYNTDDKQNTEYDMWINWVSNNQLCSVSRYAKVMNWDLKDKKKLSFNVLSTTPDQIFWFGNSQYFLVRSGRSIVIPHIFKDFFEINFSNLNNNDVQNIPISVVHYIRESNKLIIGSSFGKIYLIGKEMGDKIEIYAHDSNPVAFTNPVDYITASYKDIIASSSRNVIKIWDIKENRELHELKFKKSLNNLEMSPDGKYLAFALKNDNKIYIFDIKENKILLNKLVLPGPVNAISWSPDSKIIAASDMNNYFKLFGQTLA